jgi:AcrR family transcriptional regulator
MSRYKSVCRVTGTSYTSGMPRLWEETIEAHRHAVRDSILDATAALVADRGLRSVTMSKVADDAGIGRATLYKYFPDVESILLAWHQRQVAAHLDQLTELVSGIGDPVERLRAVLGRYATIQHHQHGGELAAQLHSGDHVDRGRQRLHDFVRDLLTAAADEGRVRTDVPAGELAAFCLHALTAATGLPSQAAVRRLVSLTVEALAPQP